MLLAQRVQALVGDMAKLKLPAESFDLIWSEGALYNIGIKNALKICHRLLRIEKLRGKYSNDREASAIIEQLAQEPEMHRRSSEYYAYEFFVVRRRFR